LGRNALATSAFAHGVAVEFFSAKNWKVFGVKKEEKETCDRNFLFAFEISNKNKRLEWRQSRAGGEAARRR
jgi:hypothetical protein